MAPRHLKAIKETGNSLLASVDIHDSVGVLDKFFKKAKFFTEIERFDRYMEKLKRLSDEKRVHYVSICSPNYLHDAHIRLALRTGANAICEKPLVINPWNLDALAEIEKEYDTKVYTILQLRYHPTIVELKKKLESQENRDRVKVELTYVTSRGPWYQVSWKGMEEKSGGIAMNIGIHFFDMLLWLFGEVHDAKVHLRSQTRMSGFQNLEWADVSWYLSVDGEDLPKACLDGGKPAFRSIILDGKEIVFSEGFTDLHTISYQEILEGRGFGLMDAKPSVELVYRIRQSEIEGAVNNAHSMAKRHISG